MMVRQAMREGLETSDLADAMAFETASGSCPSALKTLQPAADHTSSQARPSTPTSWNLADLFEALMPHFPDPNDAEDEEDDPDFDPEDPVYRLSALEQRIAEREEREASNIPTGELDLATAPALEEALQRGFDMVMLTSDFHSMIAGARRPIGSAKRRPRLRATGIRRRRSAPPPPAGQNRWA